MLDVEKLEAGQLQLVISQVDLQTLIEQSIATVEGFARPKNILIACPEIQLQLDCDEQRILRVLVNLLSNAVKFSPKDTPVEIEVSTTQVEVTIRVVDHGRGIPPEFLDSVFDKFKQVKMQDARAGTGLGLSICKTFIEEHGGVIGVTSTLDMGSTFWFTLPVTKASS
jgi:signal transduction histidine kinase